MSHPSLSDVRVHDFGNGCTLTAGFIQGEDDRIIYIQQQGGVITQERALKSFDFDIELLDLAATRHTKPVHVIADVALSRIDFAVSGMMQTHPRLIDLQSRTNLGLQPIVIAPEDPLINMVLKGYDIAAARGAFGKDGKYNRSLMHGFLTVEEALMFLRQVIQIENGAVPSIAEPEN